MYYRQKIILAILQTWGGRLARTDFQKILFLFSKKQTKPSFEFFPYRFGCFSWQSYADKRAMTSYGHLVQEEDWSLTGDFEYFTSLKNEDQASLLKLREELEHLRGVELIRLVYRRYPYYAIHSEIAYKILTIRELEEVQKARPSQTESMLFTIGYEGRSLDGFVDLLLRQNVSVLCDVRKNAFSMKNGFSKKQLDNALDGAGIRYRHIPELGIESDKRKNLDSPQAYEKLFEDYEKQTLPKTDHWIKEVIQEVDETRRVALMCFEKEACMCHRGRLAKAVERHPKFSHKISHL